MLLLMLGAVTVIRVVDGDSLHVRDGDRDYATVMLGEKICKPYDPEKRKRSK